MTKWTRRQMLKGAGVALSLPWLESLAPRRANAATTAPKRYMSLYFPNGSASSYWTPSGSGAITLSPILAPLEPNKARVLALGGIGNYSPWGAHIEPSHGHNMATAWTGVRASTLAGVNTGNGDTYVQSAISIDQQIANTIIAGNAGRSPTPLASLQVGLSTLDSYTDGLPGPHSRSISWKSPNEPLYKIVSPQAVFQHLMAGGFPMGTSNMTTTPDPVAARRTALRKSALDYIVESSGSLKTRLSRSDITRMDQFLTSVKTLETRVLAMNMPGGSVAGCNPPATAPTQIYNVGSVPPDYNRGTHATLMIDLVVLALQCDMTRVVSFMLDDARSDYAYTFLKQRTFTAAGSTPTANNITAGYHGLQHSANPDTDAGFATMGWWNADRANELVTKISAIKDSAGTSAMDNMVITFMSGMHGGNHDSLNLPIAILGGGGGVLKQGQFVQFPGAGRNLQDVHLTIHNKVFGGTLAQFGVATKSYVGSTGVINEMLA